MTKSSQTTLAPRKPRIGLMGEFSAGKSTLSNLLLEARALPEKVTATRLSPVWISYGDAPAYREDIDGSTSPVSLDHLQDIPVYETLAIHVKLQSEVLKICDLIDLPGISDPNMSPVVWQRVLPEVDAILWCTHATQAWRQSEAAVWDTVPVEIQAKSILVVTRFDKINNDQDRKRVMRRIATETEGKFHAAFPISLTEALAAKGDPQKWDDSGAKAFTTCLIDLIFHISNGTFGPIAHTDQSGNDATIAVRRVRAKTHKAMG